MSRQTPARLDISVINRQRRAKISPTKVRGLVRKVLMREGIRGGEVSVLFVGDRRMRELNRMFRGADRATDVLAFSFREGERGEPETNLLGDVVISVPTAEKQAAREGHSLEAELTILLIHGVLHLAGYDHERSSGEARRMRRQETEVLSQIERRPLRGSR